MELVAINFHCYIKPERLVDPGAKAVHGITDEFLLDKPLFIDIANDFFFGFTEGIKTNKKYFRRHFIVMFFYFF